jgi:hypothetical protein
MHVAMRTTIRPFAAPAVAKLYRRPVPGAARHSLSQINTILLLTAQKSVESMGLRGIL